MVLITLGIWHSGVLKAEHSGVLKDEHSGVYLRVIDRYVNLTIQR